MESVKEFQVISQKHFSSTLVLQNKTRFRELQTLKFNILLSL